MNIKINGKPYQEPDEQVASIGYWYDRYSRSWVVQLLNKSGDQIGDASYLGSREALESEVADMKREYNVHAHNLRSIMKESKAMKHIGKRIVEGLEDLPVVLDHLDREGHLAVGPISQSSLDFIYYVLNPLYQRVFLHSNSTFMEEISMGLEDTLSELRDMESLIRKYNRSAPPNNYRGPAPSLLNDRLVKDFKTLATDLRDSYTQLSDLEVSISDLPTISEEELEELSSQFYDEFGARVRKVGSTLARTLDFYRDLQDAEGVIGYQTESRRVLEDRRIISPSTGNRYFLVVYGIDEEDEDDYETTVVRANDEREAIVIARKMVGNWPKYFQVTREMFPNDLKVYTTNRVAPMMAEDKKILEGYSPEELQKIVQAYEEIWSQYRVYFSNYNPGFDRMSVFIGAANMEEDGTVTVKEHNLVTRFKRDDRTGLWSAIDARPIGESKKINEGSGIIRYYARSPLRGVLYNDLTSDGEAEELTDAELLDYYHELSRALVDDPVDLAKYMHEDEWFYNEVISIIPGVAKLGKKIMANTVITCKAPLNYLQLDQLKEYLVGQYSDGWGEGFEQTPIYTTSGTAGDLYGGIEGAFDNHDDDEEDYVSPYDTYTEEVFVSFWNSNNFDIQFTSPDTEVPIRNEEEEMDSINEAVNDNTYDVQVYYDGNHAMFAVTAPDPATAVSDLMEVKGGRFYGIKKLEIVVTLE